MSTTSTISTKVNGNIKTIYCHSDGYPSHHLRILIKHYNTQEKVNALIELGDLSILDESIEKPEGHSFDTPIKGYTVAFGRDRGEKDIEARTYYNISSALSNEPQEYNYFFINGSWEVL